MRQDQRQADWLVVLIIGQAVKGGVQAGGKAGLGLNSGSVFVSSVALLSCADSLRLRFLISTLGITVISLTDGAHGASASKG